MSENNQLQYNDKFANNLIKFSLDQLYEGGDIVLSLGLEKIRKILVDENTENDQALRAISAGVNISRLLTQRKQIEDKKATGFVFDEDDIVEAGD